MGRLTDHKGHYCFMKCVEKQEDTKKIRENCPMYSVCYERKMYDKLWHYEDLEELGRLIEQKHGQWIHKDNFIGKYLMCSKCSHVTGRKSNYCPNCGAKMESEVAE